MNRFPITEFTYDPTTRKFFRYGQEWKPAALDVAVGAVLHKGDTMTASKFLMLRDGAGR